MTKDNPLGYEPLPQLLKKFAVPSIIAMLVSSLYNLSLIHIWVRARYRYEKDGNMLEITQIPPTTTVEAIMDKIAELVKAGRVKEVSDMRDETDLNGLKLTIDLKRGQDPDKVMQKLFRLTPLEDSFSCNFNILIAGMPRVMGVREILNEWTAFRTECVRRRTYFDLTGKETVSYTHLSKCFWLMMRP